MQIKQDVVLQTDPALSAEVAAKDPLLETTIGPSATEAQWELNGEPGRPSLILRLRDREGKLSSSTTFTPVELKNEAALAARLSSLNEALLKVAEWRKTVESLFTRIRPWCDSLPGGTRVQEKSGWVVEERSGGYEVPELAVTQGSATMFITPVAAWVVGADGEVDMIGPGDRAILCYTRATDSWYHVPNDLPYRELPLTEPLFRELAEACLDV